MDGISGYPELFVVKQCICGGQSVMECTHLGHVPPLSVRANAGRLMSYGAVRSHQKMPAQDEAGSEKTSSGVPVHTMCPPKLPAFAPRSMT